MTRLMSALFAVMFWILAVNLFLFGLAAYQPDLTQHGFSVLLRSIFLSIPLVFLLGLIFPKWID